jgi:hypothetical protein
MDYYFSDPTHFLAGWVGFGAGLWVGPNKSTRRAIEPFGRVHFNLITINTGLNGYRYISYLYNKVTSMQLAYTHHKKNKYVAKMKDFI